MPKYEAKIIQQHLDQGKIAPCYWIYGPETLKAQELVKRIQKAFETQAEESALEVKKFLSSEASLHEILDSSLNLSLFSHQQLVIVSDAHLLKNLENLDDFFKSESALELKTVLIFLSKDFDQRKKYARLLTEKAAVIECSEVREFERSSWILYLAKRRGFVLEEATLEHLRVLEPWTLSMIDHELEKLELYGDTATAHEVLAGNLPSLDAHQFIQSFFNRDRVACMGALPSLTSDREQPLQFLGLLGWNLKQVLLLKNGGSPPKHLPQFVRTRLEAWSREWSETHLIGLLKKLAEMDIALKQSRLSALGLWNDLLSFGASHYQT